MKKIILLFIFFTVSCVENISDITFKQSNKKIVIDALFSDNYLYNKVILNYSTQFNYQNKIEKISHAIVIIKNITENTFDTLILKSEGIYVPKNKSFIAKPNQEFELNITLDGSFYKSKSKCETKVGFEIEDLSSNFSEIAKPFKNYSQFNFSEKRYIYTGDSVYTISSNGRINNKENNYIRGEIFRFKDKYKNPNLFFIFDTEKLKDEINNINPPGSFLRNDLITIAVFGINEATYKYYQTLRQLTNYEGGFFSPPPGNPTSNIDNGGLGLFDVCLIKEYKIIVR